MHALLTALAFALALATPLWWFYLRPLRRRARLAAQPFPLDWEALLRQHWPLYWRLNELERRKLQSLIQQFLDEKEFFGCDGVVITEPVRVLVAAQACLLLLDKSIASYAQLQAILIYPGAFRQTLRQRDAAGVMHETRPVRLGESWGNGRIVLSWDDVLGGLDDGAEYNVVFHEFAHQLDQADGVSDGTPILASRVQVQRWVQVFTREFERLALDSRYGLPTALDSYGAENPAEFFAVATESYFLVPHRLAGHSPALFDELKTYYGHDSRAWQER